MILKVGENFPRGGKFKPSFKTSASKNKKKVSKKAPKAINKNKEVDRSSKDENIITLNVEHLSYKKIQEGMSILGCIAGITDLKVEVELPGRTYGALFINSISDEFTKYLEKSTSDIEAHDQELIKLNQIFRVGQFIPTKVSNIEDTGRGLDVILSVKPSLINAEVNQRTINIGQLMWVNVASLSDHGYQLTNGNKNCRIFLPFDKVDDNRKLVIGEPLWCIVEKCAKTDATSTITANALNKAVLSALEKKEMNLHCVIPGMKFKLLVNEYLNNGLRVTFNGECEGYVANCYLKESLETIDNYPVGSTILGTVLYIQPITKLTYFTLRTVEDAKAPELEIGSNLIGKVLYVGGGIFLEIKGKRGFVSYRRALPPSTKKENQSILDIVKVKYPKKTLHKCRILNYHHLDDTYFCTLEKKLIHEKWFSPRDVAIGEKVIARVKKIDDLGIVVTFGCVNGFIKNIHLTNAQYSDNIKKKFKIGNGIPAKVWNIVDNNVYLTSKQVFIESDKVLKKFEDAKVGAVYPGIVVHAYYDGVLVFFYGDLKGFLHEDHIGVPAKQAFYIGQVVNVVIHKVEDGKIKLALEGFKQIKTEGEKSKNNRKRKQENDLKNNKEIGMKNDGEFKNKKQKKVKNEVEINKEKEVKNLKKIKQEKIEKPNAKASSIKNKKSKQVAENNNSDMPSDDSLLDEIKSEDEDNSGWLSETFIENDKKSKKEKKNQKKSKTKSKIEIEDDEGIFSSPENSNNKRKKKEKVRTGTGKKSKVDSKIKSKKALLPGVTDFFSDSNALDKIHSDSEEDQAVDEKKTKKKRLTPAERKELARKKEEEIRRKEMELIEATENPQSADQFDRLLLANPNSSRLWIQYMAFHIGNTQNDRARAVARKAIETINMRENQEKFNVWMALLNLENRFGDKESFDKVFEEAVRCNDSYQVYIKTINMLADTKNYIEMENKIKMVKGKFKRDPKMWLDIIKVYYKCGRLNQARNCKQGALRSVLNKKEQMDVIIQCALMEFNHGESEQGEAMFETILQSIPQRVDVWCTYVDQLVKQNKIDLARRVLDKAIFNKMSGKKIATLFKKYKTFEEKYGTEENIERLKKLAVNYKPID